LAEEGGCPPFFFLSFPRRVLDNDILLPPFFERDGLIEHLFPPSVSPTQAGLNAKSSGMSLTSSGNATLLFPPQASAIITFFSFFPFPFAPQATKVAPPRRSPPSNLQWISCSPPFLPRDFHDVLSFERMARFLFD